MTVRARFAPSPTGLLHIGNARTALFNFLFARRHGGTFVLRIEDTDEERNSEEAVGVILDGLKWLGLDWDEFYRQSQRKALYAAALTELQTKGLVYRCYADKDELALMRELYRKGVTSSAYDRRWRDKGPADRPADRDYVWRFKVPLDTDVSFHDDVQGDITFGPHNLEDFVVARSDGNPLYNFCVVVDDHDMAISHVIRGADHISNTPLQILLYQAFGWTPPRFAHLGLLHGPDGKKYSKRHGATAIPEWRAQGYLPHALRNYLARLGWSHGDDELFDDDTLVRLFDLDAVKPAASVVNPDKLKWVNQHKLMTLAPSELAPYVAEFLQADHGVSVSPDDARLPAVIAALQKRSADLHALAAGARMFFVRPAAYDPKAREKHWTSGVDAVFASFAAGFAATPFDKESLHELLKRVAEQHGRKLGDVAQPLRVALAGEAVSPPLDETLALLGREEALARLAAAQAALAAG